MVQQPVGLGEPDFDFVTDWIERIEKAGLDLADTTADVEALTEFSKQHARPSLGWVQRHTVRVR